MGFDVLRRVRWRNVGRVVGAVALVAAVVAWPRLTAPAPRVPGSQPVPLVGPNVVGRGDRVGTRRRGQVQRRRDGRRRRPEGRVRRPGKRRQVRQRGHDRARRRRAVVVAPPVPALTPVAPPRAPARPPTDPAQTEFGFEGG
jgi:hypothetical protein